MKKLAALSILGLALAGCSSTPTSTPVYTPPAVESPVTTPTPTPELPKDTVSQTNALRSAESYLSVMAFSRESLIKQLVHEKYSLEDATWAVDRVKVDWNEQAAKSAQSYLDVMPFSRAGLIKQLMHGGFTQEQAEYGVTAVGL